MYLSRIVCGNTKQNSIDNNNCYDMHRTLYRGFAGIGDPDVVKGLERFLFRSENFNNENTIIIQSHVKPRWEDLPINYAKSYKYGEYFPNYKAGEILKFKLKVSPTKRVGKKIVPITKQNDYIIWLEEKAKNGGFELRDIYNMLSMNVSCYKKIVGKIDKFSVSVDGLLCVQDFDKFNQTICTGIGRNRAFGFGLLSVLR